MQNIEQGPAIDQPTERKSGRVAFNDNGHAVWEWQTATGVFERFISDEKLQQLSAPQLALVDDASLTPRQYEGLWVHDAHRPTKPLPARTAAASRPPRLLSALLSKLR